VDFSRKTSPASAVFEVVAKDWGGRCSGGRPSGTLAAARHAKMQKMCLSCPATADVQVGNSDHQAGYPGEIVIGRARCEPPHGGINATFL
jgi:hypothetical protein